MENSNLCLSLLNNVPHLSPNSCACTLSLESDLYNQAATGESEGSDVYAKTYTLHRAKMSRQLKELNDMLTAKEQLMSECVSTEQKRESQQKQQTLEKKVMYCITSHCIYSVILSYAKSVIGILPFSVSCRLLT